MKIDKNSARTARALMRACQENGRLHSSRIKSVVTRLAETKPRGYIAILTAFQRLVRLEVQKRHSIIQSAAALSPALSDQVRTDLIKKYGDDLEFDFQVNPELIGGLRVQVGSHVWDGSVRAKLETLRNNLA
jgi:F-type H+-transporting ATPase subunit delta